MPIASSALRAVGARVASVPRRHAPSVPIVSAAVLASMIATLLAVAPLRGQDGTAAPPQLHVTATGTIEAAPDRATVLLGVETDAATAADAAARNSETQRRILDAIQRLGVPRERIRTVNFNVSARQRYDEPTRRTVVDGYRVQNIVEVDAHDLSRIALIIDAALTAGANRVAGVSFYIADPAPLREQALSKAVAAARRDADVAAAAAGGRVAGLLELVVQQDFVRPKAFQGVMVEAMRASDGGPPPIEGGSQDVQVTVTTRWRFAPNAP